jgi:predicted dienelactone hydrolase
MTVAYDPFVRGPFSVGVRTVQAIDAARQERPLPFEVWYPAAKQYSGQDIVEATQDSFEVLPDFPPLRQTAVRNALAHPGNYPLIAFSHSSWGQRRQSTFLCTHLASHGYVVAAVDHTGNTTMDMAQVTHLTASGGDTPERRAERMQSWIAARVPDIQFMLDQLLSGAAGGVASLINPNCIGMVGYSFGGWTALAVTAADRRIRATLALAPASSSQPRPGIIPVSLDFAWGRDVPTLLLVAERDTLIPLADMDQLFERIQATKSMVILRHADHFHFCDHVERVHDRARARPRTGDNAWMAEAIPPIGELCPGEHAYLYVCGLGLAHMDAILKGDEEARRFLTCDLEALLAARGVNVLVHKP